MDGSTPRHHFEGQHAAEPLESILGEQTVAVAIHARVMHGPNERMRQQVFRHSLRVALLTLHAQRQRLDATAHVVAFGRGEHAAEPVLREVDAIADLIVQHHHKAGVHLGMACQVFGGRMDDDIRAQIERLLQVRRDERVVDDGQRAVSVRDGRDAVDVVDLQQRVGQRLEIYGAGRAAASVAPADRGVERLVVGGVDAVELQPALGEVLVEQRIRAAVDVLADHDAVPGFEDGQHRVNRGESGREREAASPVLQLGDLLFQKVAGRVAAARIIPAGHGVDRFDSVCG